MKANISSQRIVLAIFFTLAVAPYAPCSELSDAIEALERPDLPSAKIALKRLDTLIEKSSGNNKVVALRVKTTIKNVFTAEHHVAKAISNAEKAEELAIQQEVHAASYRKPNSFGTSRDAEANNCIKKAIKLRVNAASLLLQNRNALLSQLKELDTLVNDFSIERKARETVILHTVVEAIATRSLGELEFTPSQTQRSIAALQELAVFGETWTMAAQDAEKAQNYDKAFELYTKVGNSEGRQRVAVSLAKELETAELFGSAIEYYEKGGNYEAAKKLRVAHPELLAASFKKLDAQALYAHVSPSVVKINTNNGHGSGFIFHRRGYILTNAHVVEGAKYIEVLVDNTRTFPAVLKAIDKDNDLAVVLVETTDKLNHLRFAHQSEVKIGTEIAAIGYPTLDLPTATMNTGRVSNTDRSYKEIQLVQLDVSINKGNSGGPIVDQRGRVMGVVTFSFDKVLKVDRFNFAISLDEIESFLKSELGEDYITR